jgi:hypothetical protein
MWDGSLVASLPPPCHKVPVAPMAQAASPLAPTADLRHGGRLRLLPAVLVVPSAEAHHWVCSGDSGVLLLDTWR